MDLKEIKLPDVAQWTDFVNTIIGIGLLYRGGSYTVREI